MFLIKLLRFLFGYVRFESGGGFPERFLNLCAQAHFPLWEVTSRGGTMKAFTTVKCYKKFRSYARKAGVRLRVKERRGLPFLLRRYRKRIGIVSVSYTHLFFRKYGKTQRKRQSKTVTAS